MARVLKVDPTRPDTHTIDEAARELTRGALVAFPTETVYGLGAAALDPAAVNRLFTVKERPFTDPLIVHLADPRQLTAIALDLPASVDALAREFWPGPLTLILRKKASVPDVVTAGQPTVAVRVPSHPVACLLLQSASVPVVAPSANLFSRPSPTSAAHVLADLGDKIDIVIDGGATSIGVESTILDLTVSPPVVRRPGGVAIAAIRRILPTTIASTQVHTATQAQPSPGQLVRHYAPRARVMLYVGDAGRMPARIADDARTAAAAGSRVGILAPEEDLRALAPRLAAVAASGRIVTMRYGSRKNPNEAARDLFGSLRELDAQEIDLILAAGIDAEGIGVAIVDRLTRAAEGRVIVV